MSSRPRVAVVYHFFAHYRGPVMEELLRSDRFDYVLVGDRTDPTKAGIKEWDGCPPERFVYAPCTTIRRPVMLQRGLLRLALRRDLDAIIYLGNAFWPSTWLSVVLARLTGKKVYFWTHGWIHRERGLLAFFRRRFYRLAHGLLVYGHVAKMIGLEEGFAPGAIHVIYNSLDYARQTAARARVTPERIDELREELFPGSEAPMMVCTTRLEPVRGLDLLLRAMIRLREEGHVVNLLLVGDGSERRRLEEMAGAESLPVQFYGACYDEDRLAELIMASNVTVAPGKVGLTAMHSLVYGTPVITHADIDHQMPEWESITPGRTGDLFERNDVEDLADVIKRWTSTRYPDEAVRGACFEIMDRFYNPAFQRRAIERCLDGRDADDLFWTRE